MREAACAFIDALAEHDASEAVEVAEAIAEDARTSIDGAADGPR